MSFTFADPIFFWVLAGAAVAWFGVYAGLRALARRRGERRTAAVRFSSLRRLSALVPLGTPGLRRLVQMSRVLTLALLVMAMARPQSGRKHTTSRTEGIDIVLAVDTSGSMQALDLDSDRPRIAERRNRLEVVKQVMERFIEKRENDQLGIVVFGSDAYTQCPLTLDHGIVATFVDQISIGMAGDATALGNGLGVAVKRLEKSKGKSKVVILLTDGRQNAGHLGPRQAAEAAKSFGVRVYTIGAGTRGKAPFLVDTIFGKQIQMQDVAIDEEGLRDIARITGGKYFRAEDLKALESIYDEIDKLERTEIESRTFMEYDERFPVYASPALVLLALELLLLGTRLRKIP